MTAPSRILNRPTFSASCSQTACEALSAKRLTIYSQSGSCHGAFDASVGALGSFINSLKKLGARSLRAGSLQGPTGAAGGARLFQAALPLWAHRPLTSNHPAALIGRCSPSHLLFLLLQTPQQRLCSGPLKKEYAEGQVAETMATLFPLSLGSDSTCLCLASRWLEWRRY